MELDLVARIHIIQHETDWTSLRGYSIRLMGKVWHEQGHQVSVSAGLKGMPEADIAILHVNLSKVPDFYRELAGRYPVLINERAMDIRKHIVSGNLVRPGDSWAGPVIIKSDLNCNGVPERLAHLRAKELGLPFVPRNPPLVRYMILESPDAVPESAWDDEDLVVERFLPERDGEYYCIRTWMFFGDRERCALCKGRDPIVKGRTIVEAEETEIPDALRPHRLRLGFDYGKFDFVIHEGEPILIDANKTPSPPPRSPEVDELHEFLAGGLESLLQDGRGA